MLRIKVWTILKQDKKVVGYKINSFKKNMVKDILLFKKTK